MEEKGKISKVKNIKNLAKKIVAIGSAMVIMNSFASCTSKKNKDEETNLETTTSVSSTEAITYTEDPEYEQAPDVEYKEYFDKLLEQFPKYKDHISYSLDGGMDNISLQIKGVDNDCDDLSLFVQRLVSYCGIARLTIDAQSFDGLSFNRSYVKELNIYSNDGIYPKAFDLSEYTGVKKLTLTDVEAKILPYGVEEITLTSTNLENEYNYNDALHSLLASNWYVDINHPSENVPEEWQGAKRKLTLNGIELKPEYKLWLNGEESSVLNLNGCYGSTMIDVYTDKLVINVKNSANAKLYFGDDSEPSFVRKECYINDPDNVVDVANLDINNSANYVYNTYKTRQ